MSIFSVISVKFLANFKTNTVMRCLNNITELTLYQTSTNFGNLSSPME